MSAGGQGATRTAQRLMGAPTHAAACRPRMRQPDCSDTPRQHLKRQQLRHKGSHGRPGGSSAVLCRVAGKYAARQRQSAQPLNRGRQDPVCAGWAPHVKM